MTRTITLLNEDNLLTPMKKPDDYLAKHLKVDVEHIRKNPHATVTVKEALEAMKFYADARVREEDYERTWGDGKSSNYTDPDAGRESGWSV